MMQNEFDFCTKTEKTQKERVYDYIKSQNRIVTTWELEKMGVFQNNLSAGSATRHARTLAKDKLIKHPEFDGKKDLHCWMLI